MAKPNNSDGCSKEDRSVLEGVRENVRRQLYKLDQRVARLQRLGDLKGADPDQIRKEAEILPILLERR